MNFSEERKKEELQRSSSSKLIKDWAIAVGYEGNFPFVLDQWTADVWLPVRDEIEEKGLVNDEVKRLDRFLIRTVLKSAPEVLPGIPSEEKPLEKWWWHLFEIAKGEYPEELLPGYLQKEK